MEASDEQWDEQIKTDVTDGRFDALFAEAIAEFEAGETTLL